jgi:cohesin loading factor subunit SCC2
MYLTSGLSYPCSFFFISDVAMSCRSQDEVARIDRLAEEVGTVQGLRSSFHPILNVILVALDAPPVFMRTKALRALGQIVTSDPSILSAV